LILCHLNHFRW